MKMLEIRMAEKNDVEKIVKIEQECFPAAEAAKEEDIYKRFEAFGENFIVAVENGKVIGFVNGCTTDKPELPDELYHNTLLHKAAGGYQTVFGLDVLPEYRKKGVAGELLKYMISLSRKRNKKGIILTCKDYLIGYYEKFGFENQGVSASSHGGAKWNNMFLNLEK
ncbi:GNAT family N-acetyltransferase [Fusobacterium sp.]|uniref:GNAT family N-acetyltransferase n=1 Tax=Fusobacterium sp. TaxID=68766 RepID=UPI0028FFFB01|nr:GNAT family N-acetyltransferase [Fusobacterium sp.]MDU1910080.1 GNAT family N-acetyltransferase [Fusobacterium sp.]